MLINVGYQFDRNKKAWLGAFMMAAAPVGAVPAPAADYHYELLTLDQMKAKQETLAFYPEAVEVLALSADAIEDTLAGRRATPYDLPEDFGDRLFSAAKDGELFKVIDPAKDVDWTEFFFAQKTAQVKAEKVPAGTVVETIMADGHVETTKTAGPDGGYRVTNPTGEQYLVDTKTFESIYETAGAEGIYRPKPDPRKVVPVDRNVAFTAPWGEEMRIRKDGVLVNSGKNDIYGIQPDEYTKTYSPV